MLINGLINSATGGRKLVGDIEMVNLRKMNESIFDAYLHLQATIQCLSALGFRLYLYAGWRSRDREMERWLIYEK